MSVTQALPRGGGGGGSLVAAVSGYDNYCYCRSGEARKLLRASGIVFIARYDFVCNWCSWTIFITTCTMTISVIVPKIYYKE